MTAREFLELIQTEHRILGSLALVLVLTLLRTLLHRVINRRVRDLRNRYIWRQTVTYFVIFNIAVGLVSIWAEQFRTTVAMLSLVAAALTLVSKELLLNFVAYWVIIWRGLFSVGDRIQIGTQVGDVMEIGFLYVTLAEVGNWVQGDDPTGRVVKVPNSTVLTQPVPNYSRGLSLIWNELALELPLASDWRSARTIALQVLQNHSHPFSENDLATLRKDGEELMFTRREPSIFIQPQGDKVRLILRYACKFHKRRRSEQTIWEELLERLGQETDLLGELKAISPKPAGPTPPTPKQT